MVTKGIEQVSSNGLSTALDQELCKLIELRNEVDNLALTSRYKFARILVKIESAPKTYGQSAISIIADRLRIGTRLIYEYLRIGRSISQEEVQHISELLDVRGYRLSWTHLRSLVLVDEAQIRSALVARWQQESIGTVEFANLVRDSVHNDRADENADSGGTRVLKRKLSFLKRLHKSLATFDSGELEQLLQNESYLVILPELVEKLTLLQRSLADQQNKVRQRIASGKADSVWDQDISDVAVDDLLGDDSQSMFAEQSITGSPSGRKRKHRRRGSIMYRKAAASIK